MEDVAGGGTVLSLARRKFGWVAGLLDQASYDEPTGRKLHVALAELGQLAGWGAFDSGQPRLAQRYNVAALRPAHSADDRPLGAHILGRWPNRPPIKGDKLTKRRPCSMKASPCSMSRSPGTGRST
jgi:hypothetical protein